MRRSPRAYSARSAQIAKSTSKSDRNSIAFISASSTISMPSFVPSVSKPHDKHAKQEQNPHYSHYNGLTNPRKSSRRRGPLHTAIAYFDPLPLHTAAQPRPTIHLVMRILCSNNRSHLNQQLNRPRSLGLGAQALDYGVRIDRERGWNGGAPLRRATSAKLDE